MNRKVMVGLVTLVTLALVAAPALLAGKGDPEAGKAVFQKKCATCHGKNGEGNQRMARMLKVEIRDLGSEEVQAKCDDELRKNITEGTGKMRPVKKLSQEDVANVIAYVRTLAKK
ncbi:MAG: cytochrome c [Candidatus Acidoferrales bacterium]